MGRLIIWLILLVGIYAIHYTYFAEITFDSVPNVFVLIGINLAFILLIFFAVRRSSYVGLFVGLGLMYQCANTSVEWHRKWQRMRYLHHNYITDFSYDKYCNLSSEDKMLMEEISIYGYTDCDDAKIPYKKSDEVLKDENR
jgi:hypothetical protein